ncbi:MAG: azurin [Myxococcota bacterium]|nr:azurin [Myxococcota bacterium]
MRSVSLVALALTALVACGSEPTEAPKEEPVKTEAPKAEAPKEEAPKAEARAEISNTVVLEANDMMQFNLKEIHVKAGEPVTLTLKHTGTMAKEAMGHNFVLLKAGEDVGAFALASASAKDSDFISPDMKDKVIANTTLVGGGESVEITFDAPAAGTYPFLCSFPGHYAMMKGEFIVH